jgi:hypothetical protein
MSWALQLKNTNSEIYKITYFTTQGRYSDLWKATGIPRGSGSVLRRHRSDIALRRKMSSVKVKSIRYVSKWYNPWRKSFSAWERSACRLTAEIVCIRNHTQANHVLLFFMDASSWYSDLRSLQSEFHDKVPAGWRRLWCGSRGKFTGGLE